MSHADSIQSDFERFHAANPHVYVELERLATQWFRAGHEELGVKMLWEVLRWQIGTSARAQDFKLNNNYTARYARLLLAAHPEWENRIATRDLRAA